MRSNHRRRDGGQESEITMHIELTPLEARVIGCLIEKQITTPEYYPLSLNALVNACNQKSNRDPVLELAEASVRDTLDQLAKKYLVSDQSGYGSRVAKYQHRFCNSAYGNLQFSPRELAIICELLLRGPQTPGELRGRAHRLCPLHDVQEVEAVLRELTEREDGPFVARLAREPGKRESRYTHLFSGEAPLDAEPAGDQVAPHASATIDELAQRLAALEAEVAEIRSLLEDLTMGGQEPPAS